jgi:hypothetical protein
VKAGKRPWSPYWPIGLLALFFVGLWVATFWLVPFMATALVDLPRCEKPADEQTRTTGITENRADSFESRVCYSPTDELAAFGTIGDMFGTVNALFSGLALAGVVLTLHWQARERRRDHKPFVIPSLAEQDDGSGGVVVFRPGKSGAIVELPLILGFRLTNSSPAAALNVSVEAAFKDTTFSTEAALPLPIGPVSASSMKLPGKLAGADASKLVGWLRTGPPPTLQIEVSYGNLDSVRWITRVEYHVSLDEHARQRDGNLLQAAINDGDGEGDERTTGAWTSTTKVALVLTPVQDSWSYREA